MRNKALPIALLLALTPSALLADTLFDNLDGITLDAQGRVRHFTGIVVGTDGRIAEVLERTDKRPARVDYRVDGKGRVVIPGLIDSHLHLLAIGFAKLTLDLSETRSLQEAQAKIRAYAAEHPDRAWVIGSGWNPDAWGLGRFPTAAEIDALVPDRPVWLTSADGHAGWANSKALALAGVTAATADPAGGRIERTAGTTRPAGVLIDTAAALVDRVVPPPRPEDRDVAFALAQDALLRHGITTATDMGTTIEDWQTFRRAGDIGRLSMRIMAYARGVDAMALIGGPGPTPWLYDDRLRMNGVALAADGALAWRGALLKAPYADDPRTRGDALLSDTQLKNLMSRAAIDNFQVAVDASGDAATAEVLDAVDTLTQTYKGDRRWRIERAQAVDPADVRRFGSHGIVVSLQPLDLTTGRTAAEARLGPQRLAGAYPWRSIAATGATLAFGSDAPDHAPDPFAGMAAASTRQGDDDQPFGGWQPQEKVTREAALAAYTAGAAYAGFAEGRFGRIERGQRADFLVLDHDPLLATPAELRGTRVLQTWINGRLAWEEGNRPLSKTAEPARTRGTGGEGR
ncbi:MAG: amidohydrolase [Novosphingobium sp.]|nr:amidohydrolase [Novosphingobium sp.]